LAGWLTDADLLVNTTSLGMTGQPPLEIDLMPMQSSATVYDIVYVPLETPLLAAARARGLRTVDGLGMLLHQAVPAFEKFFGVRPMVTQELREAVLADIAKARTG
jgi:shikimate dehydrogenase